MAAPVVAPAESAASVIAALVITASESAASESVAPVIAAPAVGLSESAASVAAVAFARRAPRRRRFRLAAGHILAFLV